MKIFQAAFNINTNKRNEMVDITSQVRSLVGQSSIKDGQATVYCPHTTAGITINENADPAVTGDILLTLNDLFPKNKPGYRHAEGNSDAHVKSSLVGCSENILIAQGVLHLGTWQGIYFCEFDGPRNRRVTVQISGN